MNSIADFAMSDLEKLTKTVNDLAKKMQAFMTHVKEQQPSAQVAIANLNEFEQFNPDQESVGLYINRFQNYVSIFQRTLIQLKLEPTCFSYA